MPRAHLDHRAGFLILVLLVLCGGRTAANPFDTYLERHPGSDPADLLEPVLGDSLERTLAVVFHPEAGFLPVASEWVAGRGPLAPSTDLSALRRHLDGDPEADAIVSFEQHCGAAGRPSSWIYADREGLRAFSLTPFEASCEAGSDLVEASDHEAMRTVGDRFFRPRRKGEFRYGPLRYETWDEAFAAPTRVATLAVLEAKLRASPDDAEARNRYAVALYAAGRRDEAIQQLERAAAERPDWSRPKRNLAIAFRQRRQPPERLAE